MNRAKLKILGQDYYLFQEMDGDGELISSLRNDEGDFYGEGIAPKGMDHQEIIAMMWLSSQNILHYKAESISHLQFISLLNAIHDKAKKDKASDEIARIRADLKKSIGE